MGSSCGIPVCTSNNLFSIAPTNVISASSIAPTNQIPVSGISPTNEMTDLKHPNIARQKLYQQKAFEFLNEALNIDEKYGDDILQKKEAIELYRLGIQELEKGVALDIPFSNKNQDLVRAHKLKNKMRLNLGTSLERLNFLTMNLHLSTLSIEAPEPSRSKLPAARQSTFTLPASPSNSNSSIPRPTALSSPGAPNAKTPRYNRAAELRAKSTNNNKPGKSSRPGARKEPPKSSAKEGLKSSCSGIKGVDKALVETILNEVVPKGMGGVKFSDISGQEKAKEALHEMVVLPSLRPELFTGLRTPARGLLLFGPPGNGKTLLARALAGESSCNLINISSASLTSKWLGEGEKLVKALFTVARHIQPTIIFIDEIDALLSERKSGEHEALRRIKTEFLLQFEGMLTGDMERTVVVAATNRPQELDDAALRRFTKRVYVRMPDPSARRALINALLVKHGDPLDARDVDKIVGMTGGYTCSDITNLARDAALAPIREVSTAELANISPSAVRRISLQDFVGSCERVRKSLTEQGMSAYEKWNQAFGDIS